MRSKFNGRKIILIIVLVVFLLLIWAPWITVDYAKAKVRTYDNFIRQHAPYGSIPNSEIHVFWVPFGRMVTTYEGGWFVMFYE